MEEEEERQGDVIGAAPVSCHLKQGSRVAAAALVIVWKGEWKQLVDSSTENIIKKQIVAQVLFTKKKIIAGSSFLDERV